MPLLWKCCRCDEIIHRELTRQQYGIIKAIFRSEWGNVEIDHLTMIYRFHSSFSVMRPRRPPVYEGFTGEGAEKAKGRQDNIPRGSFINKDKEHYVSMSDYRRLLDACPDQEWRTLLALCRIGGLRNPSETLMVKWTDVNWEMNRFLVHSPKTEHHAGKNSRIIPLFPELRKESKIQFDQAREGAVFVIDHWRDVDKNLRTHFERIIFRAGLEKWDRLFHHLRGSRSNELVSDFPSHVASTWMGQNSRVALEHYLHPREEDFQKAMEEPSISGKENPSKQADSPNPIHESEERVFC